MFLLLFFGFSYATICQNGADCTAIPTITVETYDLNDADCTGSPSTSTPWLSDMHIWNNCENVSRGNIVDGRIIRCTGNENTLTIEEYNSDGYCTGAPSNSYTVTTGSCALYRQPSGALVKRKLTWTYDDDDWSCPTGDAVIGVTRYNAEGCTGSRLGEWVEIIPRIGTCFGSETPRTNPANISRTVTCSGSSGTITEYIPESDPFRNCTTSETEFDISNGECIQWTDPTDSSYTEYRRMYFNCNRGSAAFLTIFWILLVAFLQQ